MPDYKRLVSYIYNYEDGIKKNNVGYARVEARNGQCKCTLHIAAPSLNDKQLKVYIFKREKENMEGILLGELTVRNGNGDYRTLTDSRHIMNSAYGLDDMSGIVLYLSDRKFFATSWDEAPITQRMAAGIYSSSHEQKLKAADLEAEKTGVFEKDEEKPSGTSEEETAKDNIIKINFQDTHRPSEQSRVSNIMELEEDRNQIEGEVFNDRNETEVKQNRGKVMDTPQEEVSSVEVSKKENGPEETGNDRNEGDKSKAGFDYIADAEQLKDELNSPVEILQKEDLSEKDVSKEEEKPVSDNPDKESDAKEAEDRVEERVPNVVTADTEQAYKASDAGSTLSSEVNLSEQAELKEDKDGEAYIREDCADSGNMEVEPKELQPEVTSEACQMEAERQPFFEDHPVAKKLYRTYPRMYPFEDNEVAWCVRIEPQDIGLFPMEAWILGNNSFLLHGYYSYRHLIFARINDKNGFSYILGVPGIYHNREKFMAKMFGFENFKCAKRKAQRTGEFGYWYIPITLN